MSLDALRIAPARDGFVRLDVRVNPRASASAIVGAKEGVLIVRLHAPPVDGRANDELVALIAAELGLARSDVRVVSGHRGRRKGVEARGVSVATARERLGRAAGEAGS